MALSYIRNFELWGQGSLFDVATFYYHEVMYMGPQQKKKKKKKEKRKRRNGSIKNTKISYYNWKFWNQISFLIIGLRFRRQWVKTRRIGLHNN